MERLTPCGLGGVAVYRFPSGESTALAARVEPATVLTSAATGRPVRASIRLDDGFVDDVLVVQRGDGAVEVHAHGSPVVDAAFCRVFGAPRADARTPAERLLSTALGESQLALALEQTGFDFDAELAVMAALPRAARRMAVTAAMARSALALALVTPAPLHLIGRQNAGKSTMFNRLLGRERSLVGDTPGLTRDAVAEAVVLDGYPYVLHDHAGEGPAADPIDAVAIVRARAARADGWRLLLVDGSLGPSGIDRELAATAHVVAATKADRSAAPWPSELSCHGRCSPQRDDVAVLQRLVGGWLRSARGLPPAGRVGGVAALDATQLRALEAIASLAP